MGTRYVLASGAQTALELDCNSNMPVAHSVAVNWSRTSLGSPFKEPHNLMGGATVAVETSTTGDTPMNDPSSVEELQALQEGLQNQ